MRCIICSEDVEGNRDEDDFDLAGGEYFITMGGNSVFDGSASTHLEIFICDCCLLLASGNGDVMHATVTDNSMSLRVWDGYAKRH